MVNNNNYNSKEKIKVEISAKPLSYQEAIEYLSSSLSGAEVIFTGRVRENNQERLVSYINFSAHINLAKDIIFQLCKDCWKQCRELQKIYLAHRIGKVYAGELCILIGASSVHRADAFFATRYLIEEIKKKAPIWKEEFYKDGTKKWLEGHSIRED
ncbi:MAG: molybdenum cofactor biosynthesis protein MoaE [Candidatus Dadabacteria bacterium]|nr:MAG: molybdenum cofactor biosynthesis protein MoaE [Candidatus Dadabacteria bacterium]